MSTEENETEKRMENPVMKLLVLNGSATEHSHSRGLVDEWVSYSNPNEKAYSLYGEEYRSNKMIFLEAEKPLKCPGFFFAHEYYGKINVIWGFQSK